MSTGPVEQLLVGSDIALSEERLTRWVVSMINTGPGTFTRGTKRLNSNDGIVTAEQALTAAIEHETPLNPMAGKPYSMHPIHIEWGEIIQDAYKKQGGKDITATTGELFQLTRDGVEVSISNQNIDGILEAMRNCDGSIYTLTEHDVSGKTLRVTAMQKRFLVFQDLQGLELEDE